MSIDQLTVSDAIYAIASCAPWVGWLLLQVASEGRYVRFAAAAVLPSLICIARSSSRPGTTWDVRSQSEPQKTSWWIFLEDPRVWSRKETRFSLPPIVARRTRGDATAIVAKLRSWRLQFRFQSPVAVGWIQPVARKRKDKDARQRVCKSDGKDQNYTGVLLHLAGDWRCVVLR